jgi:hypothetical protein
LCRSCHKLEHSRLNKLIAKEALTFSQAI